MPGQRLRAFRDCTKPLNLKPRVREIWQSLTWMAGGQLVSMEPQKLWISCEQRSEDMLRETKKQQPEINPTRALRPSREAIQGATGSSQLGAWTQVTGTTAVP